MSRRACGFPRAPPRENISPEALKIAFSTLKYHPDSARKLTLKEYESVRKTCFWMTNLHDDPLYIIEDGKFSTLLIVENDGCTLSTVCDLRELEECSRLVIKDKTNETTVGNSEPFSAQEYEDLLDKYDAGEI